MVECGNSGSNVWWYAALNRARVQGWGLDQWMGSASPRPVDQSVGAAWPLDQPIRSSSRWMGKLVVIETS